MEPSTDRWQYKSAWSGLGARCEPSYLPSKVVLASSSNLHTNRSLVASLSPILLEAESVVSRNGSAKCFHFVCVTAGYSFEQAKLSSVSVPSPLAECDPAFSDPGAGLGHKHRWSRGRALEGWMLLYARNHDSLPEARVTNNPTISSSGGVPRHPLISFDIIFTKYHLC